jgi:hypothetical protein
MDPTNPYHSVPAGDTQALAWIAALLFYATTWTAIAVYWLR